MPYICLARNDIPDGIVQILDLWPNTSLRNGSIDPPGQTKYVNRVQTDAQSVNSTTGKAMYDAQGLTAYLVARVEPWGSAQATGTVTVAAVAAADTVTVAGVVFTCQDGAPTAANQEFQSTVGAGSNNAAAQSLVATINDAASQALITAALGAGRTITASRVNAVVTLTISSKGSLNLDVATLATSNNTRLAKSGSYLALAGTIQTAANYAAAAAAIIARVDAGSALALANINTVLAANLGTGTELTSASGSRSAGTVAEVLSILAGRGFKLAKGTTIYDVSVPTVPDFSGTSSTGSFTDTFTVFDSQMVSGIWCPVSVGGDSESRELKPIRPTVDSTQYQGSLAAGYLAKMQSTMLLFPDSDLAPFIPWTYQKSANHTAPVSASRLVTVYNDDGTVA